MTVRSRPSATARSIAILRRRLGRPTIPTGDPAADDRLAASLPWAPAFLPGLARYVADRTEFFDEILLDALERGVRQVVIAGAGYDGRSLRYRRPGVTYFEVDHPATQADKRERLARVGADPAGISFVAVDLARQSVADELAAAGHRADAPTCFLCEGVAPYLLRADLEKLVAALAGRAAPGSVFAADLVEPGRGRPMVSQVLGRMMRTGTAAMGEPMVTILAPDEARELFLAAGWDAVTLYVPPGPMPVVLARASMG